MSWGQKTYNPLKVDQVMAQAENTGAKIIRAAQASAYEGYTVVCAGSGSQLLKVMFNPQFGSGLSLLWLTGITIDHHADHHVTLYINHGTHCIQQTVDR